MWILVNYTKQKKKFCIEANIFKQGTVTNQWVGNFKTTPVTVRMLITINHAIIIIIGTIIFEICDFVLTLQNEGFWVFIIHKENLNYKEIKEKIKKGKSV